MNELLSRLNEAVSSAMDGAAGASLERDARIISESYRLRTGSGARLLTKESEALAYAASRMPATAAAAYQALCWSLEATGLQMTTMLDCGAGTGAAGWAADALMELERICCLEREEAMRLVGARLAGASGGAMQTAQWQPFDMTHSAPLPRAQLVTEGYMLGELSGEMRIPAALRLWEAAETMLLLIEPGTPQGFANLRAVREALVGRGAYVAAPCPAGCAECPVSGEDWCHFTVRVPRSKLHKRLKGGDAPYEDEKFAYLALTREPADYACAARVLRHPQIAPGRIALRVCTRAGIEDRVVTKKDPLWKRARKIGAGDPAE